jgi:hypothetical protein
LLWRMCTRAAITRRLTRKGGSPGLTRSLSENLPHHSRSSVNPEGQVASSSAPSASPILSVSTRVVSPSFKPAKPGVDPVSCSSLALCASTPSSPTDQSADTGSGSGISWMEFLKSVPPAPCGIFLPNDFVFCQSVRVCVRLFV